MYVTNLNDVQIIIFDVLNSPVVDCIENVYELEDM